MSELVGRDVIGSRGKVSAFITQMRRRNEECRAKNAECFFQGTVRQGRRLRAMYRKQT